MDYYCKIDNNENALLLMEKELLSSLNEFCLSILDTGGTWIDVTGKKRGIIESWDDICGYYINGYIVNLVVRIIERGEYKKNIIYSIFSRELYPFFRKYGCDEKGVHDIFQHAWNCYYTKKEDDINALKAVREIALRKQPLWLRVINSNGFVLFWSIVVFAGSIYVGNLFAYNSDTHSFIVSLIMAFYALVAYSKTGIYSAFVPIGIALLVCGYTVLVENDVYNAIATCKTWLWMGVFYILWFPVLCVNHNRMKNAKII